MQRMRGEEEVRRLRVGMQPVRGQVQPLRGFCLQPVRSKVQPLRRQAVIDTRPPLRGGPAMSRAVRVWFRDTLSPFRRMP